MLLRPPKTEKYHQLLPGCPLNGHLLGRYEQWHLYDFWARPPKKCFVLDFLCDNLLIVCFISSSLVGCVESWHTYGAASSHPGHLYHRPNLGAGLGRTGRGCRSNLEKVAGRTSYILTILCYGLDFDLIELWGEALTPFVAFLFFYNFYSGDWLKIVWMMSKLDLFGCAEN